MSGDRTTDGAATVTAPRLGRRAASGALWITIETVFGQGMSIVVFSVMAHFLGPRDFGLVSISFVFVWSTKFILLDQICAAIMRKSNGTDLDYTTAFWFTLSAATAALVGLEAFSFFADSVFSAPGLGNVMRAMGVILLVMGAARAQESWLMRNFMFRTLALRSIAGVVVGGMAGVASALLGLGVWALVVQQVVTSVVGVALLTVTCPWRPAMAFSMTTAREIVHFLKGAGSGNAIGVLNDNGDTLLIAFFYGPAGAGIYAVGKRLMLALQLVAAAPINGVAMPMLAEVQNDDARLRRVVLMAISVVLTSCCAVFIGTAAIGHDAVIFVFGRKWEASAPVLSWLAVGGLCTLLARFNNVTFLVRGQTMWTMYLAGLYTILAAASFAVLRYEGNTILALPFVLPWVIVLPISVMRFLRAAQVPAVAWIKTVLPPLLAAGVMFCAVRFLAGQIPTLSPPVRLGLLVAGGGVTYCIVISALSWSTVTNLLRMAHRPRPA